MPAKYNPNAPTDKLGQPIYEDDPRYQDAINAQNQFLKTLDTKFGSTPQQSLQNVSTPTIEPNPLSAYTTPSINSTENVAKNILTTKEEPIPQYQQDSPFDILRKNIFTPTTNALSAGAKGIGDFASDVGQGIKGTASDVGNWADQNRVGLGGFATAIGAGLARRDPSEALANYNKAIIQNKQQRQEEEKFKMATDGSHPYNQQFRELFARMLPDVTAKLGDRFNSMTVQNFKDAGMGDLPVLIEKQMEISKNDPNSPISIRQRGILNSQYKAYNINIPDTIPYNQLDSYVKKIVFDSEQAFKEREIKNKEEKLALDVNKETADETLQGQKLKLQQDENKRQEAIAPAQLKKTQAEADRLTYLEKSMNPKSEISLRSQQNFYKNFPKYKKYVNEDSTNSEINEIIKDVIPDLQKTEMTTTSARERTIIEQNVRQKIEGIRQRAANYRVQLQQAGADARTDKQVKFDYANLKEKQRSNMAREELLKNKELAKHGDTFIAEGDLKAYGLTPKEISTQIDKANGAIQSVSQSKQIMDNIDKVSLAEVAGLSGLGGRLQTLSTTLNMTKKQEWAMGAYDKGVQELMDQMKKNPRDIKLILGYKQAVKAQYKQMIDSVNEAYVAKSKQIGYDARFGSPINYTQELEAAINGDEEMIDKFSQFGYDPATMLDIYKTRSFKVRKRGE
jgi:hypothetical protein